MKKTALLFVTGLLLLATSCYYDTLVEAEIPDIPPDQEISFREDIEPLFSRSGKDCTQCHNGNPTSPDLRTGNAYNSLLDGGYVEPGNKEASILFQRAPGQDHPFDVGFVLTAEEIALIGEWIDRGAENN